MNICLARLDIESNSCDSLCLVWSNNSIGVESSRNPTATTVSYFRDENKDSKDLESPNSFEYDVGKKRYHGFNLFRNDDEVEYEKGQY